MVAPGRVRPAGHRPEGQLRGRSYSRNPGARDCHGSARARFTVQVSGTVVNLRAGPSLEAPILAQVQEGDKLPVTGISGGSPMAPDCGLGGAPLDLRGLDRHHRRRAGALAVVDAQALEACPESGPSPSLRCDKAVLLAVRDALRGSNTEALHTWHSAALADFEGVRVDGQPLRVVALTVAWPTKLEGVLPPQLGQLRQLQVLDLRGHRLDGDLPPEIGQLRQLRRLDLSFNRLLNRLPPELGQLTNLQFLDLAFNEFGGPLPPELGQLTALEELSLAYNGLDGSLPPELGQLTALHTLHLHNNRFSGPWPAELGRLPSLRELSLAHNWELTGPQPPALGSMHRVGPGWFRTNPRPKSGSPAQVAAGIHPNQTDPGAGLYLLQLTGERVTATFTATHPPGPQAVRAPLLVVPPPFRPPYAIQRTVEGPGGPTYGSPEPDLPTFPRFLLQVKPRRLRALRGGYSGPGRGPPGLHPAHRLGHHPRRQ